MRPSLTGSSLTAKTTGIVEVAALCRQCRNVVRGDDHRDPAANQIGRKLRHPLVLIVGEAVYDCNVVAFYIGGLLQALAECAQTVRDRVRRCVVEKSDQGHSLLRSRRERQSRRRAADKRDELAPSYVEHGASPPLQGPRRQQ